ncbi:MAG: histidine kinase dimerization/phospho-acceptor domain-containing protein [Armatimonadota bacterium]
MKMVVDARQQYFPELADVLSKLDHDARSPLTAISGYAECLGWLSVTDAEARERYAAAVVGQARRLGRLIANAATLAGPQADAPLVEIEVAKAVDEALRELAGTIGLQGIGVSVQVPAAPVNVLWGRAALSQLLVATLESVIDGAGESATIAIAVSAQPREVAMEISLRSSWPVPFSLESFAFRAAAHLVGTRGGSLRWQDGPEPHLELRLPFSGRLAIRPAEGLERSA